MSTDVRSVNITKERDKSQDEEIGKMIKNLKSYEHKIIQSLLNVENKPSDLQDLLSKTVAARTQTRAR